MGRPEQKENGGLETGTVGGGPPALPPSLTVPGPRFSAGAALMSLPSPPSHRSSAASTPQHHYSPGMGLPPRRPTSVGALVPMQKNDAPRQTCPPPPPRVLLSREGEVRTLPPRKGSNPAPLYKKFSGITRQKNFGGLKKKTPINHVFTRFHALFFFGR